MEITKKCRKKKFQMLRDALFEQTGKQTSLKQIDIYLIILRVEYGR